jgi:5-(carboxyamino)imidazole ribonucleotide mutase
MFKYAEEAVAKGLKVIIAAAGGAAHLPGMVAAKTILPVIGVPIQSKSLSGIDSLLSIVQMPAGVPVATVAIGVAGAKNAALLAIQILATQQDGKALQEKLSAYKLQLEHEALESNKQLND